MVHGTYVITMGLMLTNKRSSILVVICAISRAEAILVLTNIPALQFCHQEFLYIFDNRKMVTSPLSSLHQK